MVELKKILADMAKGIVSYPDSVIVNEEIDDDGDITLVLSVHPDDMGKVIGKRGKIARAIRLIIKSASNLSNQRVSVEIR